MQTIQIVAPIFLIIFIGYLGRRFGLVRDDWVHLLNRFIYFISLPALILVSFWNINWHAGGLGGALMWNFVLMCGFAIVAIVILGFLRISKAMKASVFMSVMVGNTV